MQRERRFDAAAMTTLSRVTDVAPSPCGRHLAVAVKRLASDGSRYVGDLWRVSLAEPSAPPVRLTRGRWNDGSPRYRADGALGFLSNRPPSRDGDGDAEHDEARAQLWILPAEGGEPEQLTDEPLGVESFRFPREGGSACAFAVVAGVLPGVPHDAQRAKAKELADNGPTALRYTSMPVRHWDHWLAREAPHVIAYAADGTRRDLTPDADREHRELVFGTEWDLAADGSRAVITCVLGNGSDGIEEVALRVIDVATATHVDVGHTARAVHCEAFFSPDGARIACVRIERRDGEAENPTLWVFDDLTAGARGHAVAEAWDVWPGLHGWTGDGAALLATADLRATTPAFRVGVADGEVTRLTAEDAGGSHGDLHAAGGTLVGVRSRLVHPPEPFRAPLTANARPELLGGGLSGFTAADGEAIARVEGLEVEGDGGDPVQSLLVVPAAASAPHPLVFWVHGGPIGHFGDGWHWRWNPLVLADAGYAVALPNPRGSTGFGQAFIQGIWNNEWGGACYRDLVAVADAVCARDDIDAGRTAAMGGSFGGYMANWIGSQNDRFDCLISHAGIFHFPAFTSTTDYPAYFRFELGLDNWAGGDDVTRFSPHTDLDKWTTPTLILHGEKDYRVPVSEALLLFDALQSRGIDSELVVYPDENHWILRPRNTRHWYATVESFLARHLGG